MKTQITKKLLLSSLIFTGLICANSAFAQNAQLPSTAIQAPVKNLQQNMKELGSIFKALSTAMNDPAQNAESAKQASRLVDIFKLTINQVPDSIDLFPINEQTQALEDYKKLSQNQIDLAEKLSAAFTANDNTGAALIMTQMNDTKKEGHTKYK